MFPWKPPNFVILPAAHKQGFPRTCRILIMWPWPRPFIWSSWTIVLTPGMRILCRHIQVYTLRRLSIDGFSFERVAQFNLERIFSKLDSGFQSLVGFRIPWAGFRNPDSLTWGELTVAVISLLRVFLLKKDDRNPGSTWTFRFLISFPYHHFITRTC